mgnify:CR=1 FL=1
MSSKIRIRKRGDTYSYSFDISKHPRRMKEKGGFSTEDEAFDAGVQAYANWKNGNIGITSERVTLKDYLASWLENVARPNVKRTTYVNYQSAINKRIAPFLGNHILQELRPRHIDGWLKNLAKEGLARGTIRQTKTVLSTALKYAIYPAELIVSNPSTGLSIPRSAPKQVIERTLITPEQAAALFEHERYRPVLKLLYHTGMRISEAMGLTWDDIDLKTGEITIVRQRIQDYFETPKTESSARTFYADAALLVYLRALKAAQAKDEMRLGEAYQITYEDTAHDRAVVVLPKKLPPAPTLERRMLLCIKENGAPILGDSFKKMLQKHGLNAHSFRHTHATQLVEAGAKPVDVAARLGHKDATITQNLYTHDTEEMQQETARIFGEIVGK